jgi:predicted PurR-regulated permease PerM
LIGMNARETGLPATSRFLIAAAALVIVVAGLRAAAPVLILFAMASFIVIVTRPAVAWLQRRRVPTAIAITFVIVLTFGLLGLLVSIAVQSISELRTEFPAYVDRYQAMEASVIQWLAQRDVDIPPALHLDVVTAERAFNFATGALRGLAGLVSASLLVLVIAIFGMIEANEFPAKLRTAFEGRVAMSRFTPVLLEVQHYLAIKTAVSLATGLLVGIWTWLAGLDFAVTWGLLAFALNFVPSIGSIIAAIPAVLLALVQLGPNGAMIVALGYLGVNTLLGNFLEPTWLGRRLGLSPLVVILSVVFWGWLWGPIGFLLAVPLTMIWRIMLENNDEYRWIAVLMAPAPSGKRQREASKVKAR